MKAQVMIKYFILVLMSIVLTACRSSEPEKITAISEQNSVQMTDMLDSTGFQKGWINNSRIAKYSKVMVDVSISDNKIENSALDNLNTRKAIATDEEDLQYVTDYTKGSFDRAFANSTQFQVVEKPGKDVLQVRFIVTQLVPNDALVSTASFIAGSTVGIFLMPVGIAMQAASNNTRGAIAAEIIVRDSVTGEVVAVLASREKGATTILFNTMDFTTYGNVRSIVDTWTGDLVNTLDQARTGTELKAADKVQTIALVQ